MQFHFMAVGKIEKQIELYLQLKAIPIRRDKICLLYFSLMENFCGYKSL